MPACKQGYVYVGCSPAFLLPSAPNNTEKHSKKAILFLPSFCAPKQCFPPMLKMQLRGHHGVEAAHTKTNQYYYVLLEEAARAKCIFSLYHFNVCAACVWVAGVVDLAPRRPDNACEEALRCSVRRSMIGKGVSRV